MSTPKNIEKGTEIHVNSYFDKNGFTAKVLTGEIEDGEENDFDYDYVLLVTFPGLVEGEFYVGWDEETEQWEVMDGFASELN